MNDFFADVVVSFPNFFEFQNFDVSSSFIVKLDTISKFDWLIRGPSKAVLNLEKAYWTSNSVTTESSRVLKDKCGMRVVVYLSK